MKTRGAILFGLAFALASLVFAVGGSFDRAWAKHTPKGVLAKAEEAYQAAKTKDKMAFEAFNSARASATQARKAYFAKVRADDGYRQLYVKLRKAIAKRNALEAERIGLQVSAKLIAERDELNRQWGILKSEPGQPVFKKVDRKLRAIIAKIKSEQKKIDARKALFKNVAAAQDGRIKNLKAQLLQKLYIDTSTPLAAWLAALTILDRRDKQQLEAVLTLILKHRLYLRLLESAAPPHLATISVSAAGQGVIYAAEWRPVGSDTTAGPDVDADVAKLRRAIAQIETDISDIKRYIARINRKALLERYSALSSEIQKHAADFGDYKKMGVYGPAVVEGVGTFIEIWLSSGAETARRKLAEKAAEAAIKVGGAVVGKFATEKIMERKGNEVVDNLGLKSSAALGSSVGDGIEFGITTVAEASFKLFEAKNRAILRGLWGKTTAGKIPLLGKLKLGDVDDLKKGVAITAVVTAVKAWVGAYYEGKAKAEEVQLYLKIAEHTSLQIFLDVTFWSSKRLNELLAQYQLAAADARNRIYHLRRPRELAVTTDKTFKGSKLPDELTFELRFSTFLTKSPVLTFGDNRVTLAPKAGAGDTDTWVGTLKVEDLPQQETMPIVVGIDPANQPYQMLDADPASPAILRPESGGWLQLEAGEDKYHRVNINPEQPVDLSGLWISENGSVLRVVQGLMMGFGKASYTARWVSIGAKGRGAGFKENEEAFTAVFDGKNLTGQLLLRFEDSKDDKCFLTGVLDQFEMTISKSKKILNGRYKNSFLIKKACGKEDGGWQTFKLIKKEG